MDLLQALFKHLSLERLSWFGAGVSVAAAGVIGYQVVASALAAAAFGSGLPGLQPEPTLAVVAAADAAGPTPGPRATRTAYPGDTPRSTSTPYPTDTPRPTRTPVPTDTPRPTPTPYPTDTPRPTRTPYPTDTP
ncbi:MAG: hypothetical protein JO157_08575, partial [Acetobacteraceae bacterium]|nr:hypothetical protein [Acetobacteraceae bacterium]